MSCSNNTSFIISGTSVENFWGIVYCALFIIQLLEFVKENELFKIHEQILQNPIRCKSLK